jgi:hypothetical protein
MFQFLNPPSKIKFEISSLHNNTLVESKGDWCESNISKIPIKPKSKYISVDKKNN